MQGCWIVIHEGCHKYAIILACLVRRWWEEGGWAGNESRGFICKNIKQHTSNSMCGGDRSQDSGIQDSGTGDLGVNIGYVNVAATVDTSFVFSLSYYTTVYLPTVSTCFYLPEKSSDLQSPLCMHIWQARGYGERTKPSPGSPQAMNGASPSTQLADL